MKSIAAALWAETLKVRRSKVFWISLFAFLFLDVVMAFFMFVLKNPDFARKYGLIAAKAAIAGQADWPSYLWMLTQGVAVAGVIGFGFIASWVFGREYSDRTYKDWLALPASRSAIVASKLIAVGAWCALLALLVFAAGLAAGHVVVLDGWSLENIRKGAETYFITCGLTILPVTCVAFFASFGRGYLPPLGFVVLTLLLAQVITVLGYGQYFPWAVAAIFSGAAGEEAARMGAASYIVLSLTALAGLIGTFAWWRYADQA